MPSAYFLSVMTGQDNVTGTGSCIFGIFQRNVERLIPCLYQEGGRKRRRGGGEGGEERGAGEEGKGGGG